MCFQPIVVFLFSYRYVFFCISRVNYYISHYLYIFKSLVDLAKKMHKQNNLTFNEAMDVLKAAESAYEAAENAYKVSSY